MSDPSDNISVQLINKSFYWDVVNNENTLLFKYPRIDINVDELTKVSTKEATQLFAIITKSKFPSYEVGIELKVNGNSRFRRIPIFIKTDHTISIWKIVKDETYIDRGIQSLNELLESLKGSIKKEDNLKLLPKMVLLVQNFNDYKSNFEYISKSSKDNNVSIYSLNYINSLFDSGIEELLSKNQSYK